MREIETRAHRNCIPAGDDITKPATSSHLFRLIASGFLTEAEAVACGSADISGSGDSDRCSRPYILSCHRVKVEAVDIVNLVAIDDQAMSVIENEGAVMSSVRVAVRLRGARRGR